MCPNSVTGSLTLKAGGQHSISSRLKVLIIMTGLEVSMQVLGTHSFVMKVRSRQGVEKLAVETKSLGCRKGANYEAL